MKKQFAVLGLALALAACGGQAAHAATNDLIANNLTANPAADGRVYSFSDSQYVTQISPSQFTITHSDGTTQSIADVSGAKFTGLKTAPNFAASWIALTDMSGRASYVNLNAFDYSLCNGGYFVVGGHGHSTVQFSDPGCTAFSALKAASN